MIGSGGRDKPGSVTIWLLALAHFPNGQFKRTRNCFRTRARHYPVYFYSNGIRICTRFRSSCIVHQLTKLSNLASEPRNSLRLGTVGLAKIKGNSVPASPSLGQPPAMSKLRTSPVSEAGPVR